MYCTNDDKDDCTKFDDRVRTGLPYIKKYGLEDLFYKYGVDGNFFSKFRLTDEFYNYFYYFKLNYGLMNILMRDYGQFITIRC